jgi:2,5-furandicarboxylate decarboxylase 1
MRSPQPIAPEEGFVSALGPVRTLRDWLDRLAESGRLSIARPGIGLKHEAAAVANRLDGRSASLFPQPGGHSGTIVSGLVSNRA